MTPIVDCARLFYSFFKVGVVGFGGGYAMMSMIMVESAKFSVTTAQFADLNALDMIVPGPLAINAATYVGYLSAGVPGALAATVGVCAPSFFIVSLVLHFLSRFRDNAVLTGALAGIKPAAVGLIAAAALLIAKDVLVVAGGDAAGMLKDPLGTISFLMAGVFLATAVANIRFKVNPILLTVLAGVIGGVFGDVWP